VKQLGVYVAKTQLPRLLDEVQAAATIVITRHGLPVARLMPMGAPRRGIEEAIAALREAQSEPPRRPYC